MKCNIINFCFLWLIGSASFSHAASLPSTKSNLVDMNSTINSGPTFEITLGALYLQPSSTNLDYAVLGYPLPVQSPHWDVQSIKPGYSGGFTLGGRYYFHNMNDDLYVNWDHLQTSDSDFTQAGNNQFVVFMFQAGPSAGQSFNDPSQQARSTAKFNYDVVNVNVGHYFNYDERIQLRLFIGISTAQLKENLSTTFQDNASTFSINSTNNSKFTGTGPLIGIDGVYKLPYGIGIIGTIATSALVGSVNATTNYTSRSPELAAAGITTNHQSITPADESQVVPGLDGKLGLNYSHSFANHSIFTVAIGYEYVTYFDALVAYNPSVVFGNVNTGTIALSSLDKSVSDYSLNGPFVNIGFRFS